MLSPEDGNYLDGEWWDRRVQGAPLPTQVVYFDGIRKGRDRAAVDY